MFQIYTGNGKGKTTAAIGLAIRAIGAGKRVGWICFDKGGTHYSERKVLDVIANSPFSEAKLRCTLQGSASWRRLEEGSLASKGCESAVVRQSHAFGSIDFRAFGLDRIDPVTGRFRFGVTAEDIHEAERGLTLADEWITSDQYDLIILDEINSTVDLGMLKVEDVLSLIVSEAGPEAPRALRAQHALRARSTELVFTGRNAPAEFLDRADLVTEMTLVKHYFYRGVRAREGFDY